MTKSILVFMTLALVVLAGCGKQPAAEDNASSSAGAGETSGRAFFAKDVMAAWEKAGAKVGWLRTDFEGNLWFSEGTSTTYVNGPITDGDVPAFEFEKWPEGGLTDLPEPAIDFGLDLTSTRVTDKQLADIARFENLVALDLENTNIGDVGADVLASLPKLRYLNLHNADLTDAGLTALAQIKTLRYLDVIGMNVQRSTIYQVQKAIPGCVMFYR